MKRTQMNPFNARLWTAFERWRATKSARESVRKITTDLTEIKDLFAIFKAENQERSKLFEFWDKYCFMVTTRLQFLKAERTGNWKLHLFSTAAMLPRFFA